MTLRLTHYLSLCFDVSRQVERRLSRRPWRISGKLWDSGACRTVCGQATLRASNDSLLKAPLLFRDVPGRTFVII